jgi:Family of unknown function (DUF6236)
MDRGIITTSSEIKFNLVGFTLRPSLTPEAMRFYLLYWDKIIIPTNNLIHTAVPDEDDLVSLGAIWRPCVRHAGKFGGNDLAKTVLKGQAEIVEMMLKDKSTDWVMHQPGADFCYLDSKTTMQQAIRVDLIGALPAPTADIPINEILEFRERRRVELGALHAALDEFYLEILKSPDPSLSTKVAFSNLQQQIESLNKVAEEKYKKTRKFDFSAEINFSGKDLALAAAGGAAVDHLSGFTFPVITTVSALASFVKITGKLTKTYEYTKENLKLGYLSQAAKEGVLSAKT